MKVTACSQRPGYSSLALAIFSSHVSAGFPSPADDYVEDSIDLNKHLIKRPAATFFARASGDSLIEIGIKDGDLLIIDRSLQPRQNDVVIVALNGELTCKRLDLHGRKLMPANPRYTPIAMNDDMDVLIEGVVTHSIRYHRTHP